MLDSIRFVEREAKKNTFSSLQNNRELTINQIYELLEEAKNAHNIGAFRSALLVAWSGTEAILRRIALKQGLQGKINTSPTILIRELSSSNYISPEDRKMLESFRQLRSAVAHGLFIEKFNPDEIHDLIDFSTLLLNKFNLL